MSMSIRYDHGLAVPGYYDNDMFRKAGAPTHEQKLKSTHKGLPEQLSRGSAVEIDGKRVCNLDTMMALVRLGYAKQITSPPMWMSTEIGRQISPQTSSILAL